MTRTPKQAAYRRKLEARFAAQATPPVNVRALAEQVMREENKPGAITEGMIQILEEALTIPACYGVDHDKIFNEVLQEFFPEDASGQAGRPSERKRAS